MPAVSEPSQLPHVEQAYRVMGLTLDSSALRIKREYRRLAKLWHPDTCPPNSAEQRRATERMREINGAYQLIKHAPLRYRVYATGRARQVTKPPTPPPSMAPDRLEYVVRFVCGVLFGLFVSVAALVSGLPAALAAVIPLATGVAAVVYGDQFWYGILEYSWAWWP